MYLTQLDLIKVGCIFIFFGFIFKYSQDFFSDAAAVKIRS